MIVLTKQPTLSQRAGEERLRAAPPDGARPGGGGGEGGGPGGDAAENGAAEAAAADEGPLRGDHVGRAGGEGRQATALPGQAEVSEEEQRVPNDHLEFSPGGAENSISAASAFGLSSSPVPLTLEKALEGSQACRCI